MKSKSILRPEVADIGLGPYQSRTFDNQFAFRLSNSNTAAIATLLHTSFAYQDLDWNALKPNFTKLGEDIRQSFLHKKLFQILDILLHFQMCVAQSWVMF